MVAFTGELALKLPAPAVSEADVAQLVAVLREAGDWLTAKECAALMGDGVTDRAGRAIASAARPVVVSFPGSKGYKLWQLCTIAEVSHCIATFESQGSEMIKMAVLYRQAFHKRFSGAPEES